MGRSRPGGTSSGVHFPGDQRTTEARRLGEHVRQDARRVWPSPARSTCSTTPHLSPPTASISCISIAFTICSRSAQPSDCSHTVPFD